MFIAIIKQPFVLITCTLCTLLLVFCSPFILCVAGGLAQPRRLCSSVIRKGREGECFSAGLSVLYSSKELPLICSRFDVWQHGLQHHTAAKGNCALSTLLSHPTLPFLLSFLFSHPFTRRPACPPPPSQPDYYILSLCLPTSSPCSPSLRPVHQHINFSIIIDTAALLKSSDFCQGHSCWEWKPCLCFHLKKQMNKQAYISLTVKKRIKERQLCWVKTVERTV